MTQQIINIGTGSNTADGDPIRTCFAKSNANFTELYSISSSITASQVGAIPISLLGVIDGVATLDNNGLLHSTQTIPLYFSGDVTGSGIGSITLTLSENGVIPGEYSSVFVDSTGRVYNGTLTSITGTTGGAISTTIYSSSTVYSTTTVYSSTTISTTIISSNVNTQPGAIMLSATSLSGFLPMTTTTVYPASSYPTLASVLGTFNYSSVNASVQTLPPNILYTSVAFNGSLYCAVSRNSLVVTSSDGITWNQTLMPSNVYWKSIAWGGSLFVALSGVYGSDTIVSSPNGVTWSYPSIWPAIANWNSVIWGGSMFCAIGYTAGSLINQGIVATSPDGRIWTSRTLSVSSNQNISFSNIVWGGSLFCVMTSTNSITSPDGINWTSNPVAPYGLWNSIAWNGTVFCACSTDKAIRSVDGINWLQTNIPLTGGYNNIYANGSTFYLFGNNLLTTSVDGINWAPQPSYNINNSSVFTGVSTGSIFCALSMSDTTGLLINDASSSTLSFVVRYIYGPANGVDYYIKT
jgi:hypothetical protein